MEDSDVREMFDWLERLAKNPFADDDATPVVPGSAPLPLVHCHRTHLPSDAYDIRGDDLPTGDPRSCEQRNDAAGHGQYSAMIPMPSYWH